MSRFGRRGRPPSAVRFSLGESGGGPGKPVVSQFADELDIVDDPDAVASWTTPAVRPGTGGVTRVEQVVPPGFTAWARVFHPLREPEAGSWRAVAEANGRILHPEAQWHGIATPPGATPPGTAPARHPRPPAEEGDPGPSLTAALLDVLRGHTSSQRMEAAVWEGWGDVPATWAPLLHHFDGFRRYLVVTGPLEAITRPLWHHDEPTAAFHPLNRTASIWWPQDRAWCVVSEIDFAWTYVGGTEACVRAVLEDPRIEALPARPTDRADVHGDLVNTGGG